MAKWQERLPHGHPLRGFAAGKKQDDVIPGLVARITALETAYADLARRADTMTQALTALLGAENRRTEAANAAKAASAADDGDRATLQEILDYTSADPQRSLLNPTRYHSNG